MRGEKNLGVIDTLSLGFSKVARKVWLAALPALLDLFLWLGPKVSIAPVIHKTVVMLREASAAVAPPGGADTGFGEMFEAMMGALENTVGRTNLLGLLAWGRLGVPSVAGLRPIDEEAQWVIELNSYWQTILWQALIMAFGLVLACLFLGLLAQETRDGQLDLGQLLRRVPLYWVRMVAIFAPLLICLIFSSLVGMLFGPFIIFVAVGILWLMIYMTFVPQAITLGEAKPLQALLSSFTVVRFNFWATLGLILLTNLISTGLGLIWHRIFARSALMALLAILANAYVGTALTMALFIFYRDRIIVLREAVERQRSV